MSTARTNETKLVQSYHGRTPVRAFLALSTVVFFVCLMFHEAPNYLGCNREHFLKLRLYTLVTYAVCYTGLSYLLVVTAFLLAAVYFIGDWLTQRRFWMLMAGSAVLGALLFCAMVDPPATLVGGGMVAWGLAGAVMAVGLPNWRNLGVIRRLYLVLNLLVTLPLLVSASALGHVQLLVSLAGFSAVCLWRRFDSGSEAQPPCQTHASSKGETAPPFDNSRVADAPPTPPP